MNNKLNKSTKSQRLFKILITLTTGFMVVQPLHILFLNYLFRIPSLLVIFLLIFHYFKQSCPKYIICYFVLAFVILVNLTSGVLISFDLTLSIVSLFMQLLLITISGRIIVTASMKRFIYINAIIVALVYIGYAVSPLAHFDGFRWNCPYLTFGLHNSNYAGIIAFLIMSVILISMNTSKKKYIVFNAIIILVMEYLIYQTNTRTALAVSIIAPVASFVLARRKVSNIMVCGMCSIPFLFVPFYLNLYTLGVADGEEIMGKSVMSGRQEVFAEYIATLHDDFEMLFGNLGENLLGNAHNGPLAIYSSLGVIGAICVFYIMINKLIRINKAVYSISTKFALFVIIACFILTCGEATLFLGGFPSITYIFMFYIMANSNCISENGK